MWSCTEKTPCWICDSALNKHSYTFSFFKYVLLLCISAVHYNLCCNSFYKQKYKSSSEKTKIKCFPLIKTVPVVKWLQPVYITAQDPFIFFNVQYVYSSSTLTAPVESSSAEVCACCSAKTWPLFSVCMSLCLRD